MARAFTLKLITRQAGGGEIVRTRRVEGAEATIGRAADRDIVLSDLAVDPEHARLVQSGPGRVTAESLTGVPFLVGGKSVQRADLDVTSHPVLTFGTYDLALSPGEDRDEVAVAVSEHEDDHYATPSLFSLKATLFGRRRMAWTMGLLIVALCLLLPAAGGFYMSHLKIHPDRQWSTGPLSKSHAFLEKDCQACHQQAFVSVRDTACKACHQAGDQANTLRINAHLRDEGSPFAARLVFDHAAHDKLRRAAPMPATITGKIDTLVGRAFNHPNDRCASCHREHAGEAGPIADAKRPEKPTLLVTNDCAGCHAKLKMRLSSTTLIDTPDWNRHPGFRPQVTLAAGDKPVVQRIALAAHPRENSGLTFSHRQHLDPTGGVARQAMELGIGRGYGQPLDCASCHHLDGTLRNYAPIVMERDCGACHSLAFASGGRLLPHGDVAKVFETLQGFYGGGGTVVTGQSGRRLPGDFRPMAPAVRTVSASEASGAFRAAFQPGGACHDCHTISWDGPGPLGVNVAPVHLAARFLIRGGFDHSVPAHRGQGAGAFECTDCHAARLSDSTSDVSLPDVAKCASCHGKTKAQTPAAASGQCEDCHSFHTPGVATRKPGRRPVDDMRWSNLGLPAGTRPGA